MAIMRANGKYEIDFDQKATVIDPKNPDDTLHKLIWMIVNLDLRVQKLERRL